MIKYTDCLKKYVSAESKKYTPSIEKEVIGIEKFHDTSWRIRGLLTHEGVAYQLSHRLNAGRLVQRLPTIHSFASALCERGVFGELTISIGDKPSFDEPCVSFSSSKIYDYLIPDPYFCRTNAYHEEKDNIRNQWIPISERQDTIFWRGAATGSIDRPDGRFSTVHKINLDSDPKFDVKFATSEAVLRQFYADNVAPQNTASITDTVWKSMTADRVPFIDFMNYRWHLDLDGNSNAWDSMFKKLLLGSPVIKIGSRFKQWYYDDLISQACVDWLSGADHLKQFATDLDLTRAEDLGAQCREFALKMSLESELLKSAAMFPKCGMSLYAYSCRTGVEESMVSPLDESMLMRSAGDFRSLSDNLYRHGYRQEAHDVFQRGIEVFPPEGADRVSRMAHLERLKLRLLEIQE